MTPGVIATIAFNCCEPGYIPQHTVYSSMFYGQMQNSGGYVNDVHDGVHSVHKNVLQQVILFSEINETCLGCFAPINIISDSKN